MKINFSFISHLKYRLYVYLALLIAVPAATCFLVNLKTKPKDFEKFHIFIGATIIDKEQFSSQINNLLSEDLEIKIEGYKETDALFQTQLDSFGRTSDLLIMPKSVMDTQEYLPYVSINEDNKYYDESNYIGYERHIGILLNKEIDCYLGKYLSLNDEPYYALISNSTVHGEGFFEKYTTNQVERVLTLLLS